MNLPVSENSGQNVDLTGYAKEAWVQEGFQPKGNYALASAVPTKVSQLTNDKGYLTEHQDISGKLDTDKLPQAVADALASGKIRGAAVDVVTAEPIRKENPLLTAPNCLITPHMAWAPLESRRRLLNTVADNVRCFLDGKPQNVVN